MMPSNGRHAVRGQIIWMPLTSRPDLLPIDLKRQGRAEVHIPLLSDQGRGHRANAANDGQKEQQTSRAIPRVDPAADLGAIWCAFGSPPRALVARYSRPTDLEQTLAEFIPSAQGLEKEAQALRVLERTSGVFAAGKAGEDCQPKAGHIAGTDGGHSAVVERETVN
jgi:hypothetical protein